MDAALDFPATTRNRDAILDVLKPRLTSENLIEIASGSGQHVVHFAPHFPQTTFWPSDMDPDHVQSVNTWIAKTGVGNVKPCIAMSVTGEDWRMGKPVSGMADECDALFCANMIHISPIEAMHGLFEGAGKRMGKGAQLFLYGPFLGMAKDAPSNKEFDASLKSRNSKWGVRHMVEVRMSAKLQGFDLVETVPMPANNFVLVFKRG